MYSNQNNDNKKKPKKLLYIDKISILDSVKSMVRSGESNIGFMTEIILSNWDISRAKATRLVLEGIIQAKNN